MTRLLRDPLYTGALAALVAVSLIAVVLAAGSGSSSAAAQAARNQSRTAVATRTGLPATATPAPAPTPQLYEVLLDARRALDLSALRDALLNYRRRFGAYPTTGGALQTVCKTPGDAGCALSAVSGTLSYNDGEFDYLYASDGRAFTLWTRLQTPVTPNGCDGTLPPALAGLPVYCLGSKGEQ
ncbi:MAG: hypothetical protein IVW36_03615 [Dehalococcoidia bacterium]|nr:hypothetical protein [Dehalococcoidia bacterium]